MPAKFFIENGILWAWLPSWTSMSSSIGSSMFARCPKCSFQNIPPNGGWDSSSVSLKLKKNTLKKLHGYYIKKYL